MNHIIKRHTESDCHQAQKKVNSLVSYEWTGRPIIGNWDSQGEFSLLLYIHAVAQWRRMYDGFVLGFQDNDHLLPSKISAPFRMFIILT